MKEFEDAIIGAWGDYPETVDESILESGGMLIQNRIRDLAFFSASRCSGDLVEIGAWRGWTTTFLAAAAHRFGRKVIVIDPWPEEDDYNQFLESVHHYRSVIDVYRTVSQEPLVVDLLKSRNLCFVFVDGMHTYEAVKSDLETVRHCAGIIAIDDVSWNGGIRKAVDECIDKKLILNSSFRECYLI